MKKKIIYELKEIIKETKEQRQERLASSMNLATRVKKQKKGKGSYDRSNKQSF